jgi:predicted dehydrogenase
VNAVRLGMIGCGLISHAHGKAAQKSAEAVRFVSCASRRADVAKAWAETYGCDSYHTDYREMLRNKALDGVVIATWPSGHREQIEAALDAGVRFILCEKSLVTSDIDALAIREAARRAGATVVEGFMYRHHDVIRKAEEIVSSGALGTIDSIHATFHMYDPETADAGQNWRQNREAGGGVLHDFLCYPVDAANRFAGALPVRVFASGSDSEKHDVTNRLYAQIDYANGSVATVASSRKAAFQQALTVAGSQAILEVPLAWSIPGDAMLRVTTSPSFLAEERTEYRFPREAPHDSALIDFPVFIRQLENFARVILETAEPVMSLESSVVNEFTLSAIERSYRSGMPERVDLPQHFIDTSKEARNG